MKAVVLAAGEGKRMHPLSYTRPKVMVPLAGKPILEHVLIEIKQAGITDMILVVGYHDQAIRDYFGDGERWGISIQYMTQRKQLGTADAINLASSLLSGTFLLANGDAVVRSEDIRRIASREDMTMGLVESADTTDMGVVEVAGDGVLRIHEKVANPPSNLVNAGIYLLTPAVFEAISETPQSPRGEYELTDSIQLMIGNRTRVGYEMLTSWLNISYPWDMLKANAELMATMQPQNEGRVEDYAVLKGPVSIGRGTLIRSGAYIEGPVTIGEDCDIGPNCYIRPATTIGDRCHIGNAVEIKNSIIMSGTKVPHHNYVGDSVIGEDCNFGAGTKVANLKLDKGTIRVGDVETGLRKLGVIMGDRVQTGINSCLNVGCCLGNDSVVGPGMVAKGVIRPRAKIF